MYRLQRVFFTLIFLLLTVSVVAQSKLSITGQLISSRTKEPISFATVTVNSTSTKKVITGAQTQNDGSFTLSTDSTNIYLSISNIGFESKTIRNLNVSNNNIDLGKIILKENSQWMEEVQIVEEKSTIEFKLDKRVFNVGSDLSSTGMGALDLLNNVPSVNVDIEGQISLRGNAGVQILINGKPSVLADEGSNALGTLTADMIESVEVITNPSAKYEAEGSSGIINIILKKEEKKGVNGSVSVNTGVPNNHSIGISLNKRTENFNFFTQLGAGYRTRPSYDRNTNRNYTSNTIIESDGEDFRNENFYNVILGTDYYINDLNVITLSGNFAYEIEDQPSEYRFNIYNNDQLVQQYSRIGATEANNPKYQYDLQYRKQFRNNEDHNLLMSVTGHFFGKDQSSEFTNEVSLGNNINSGQRNNTDYYQADYNFKLDYTNPITEEVTIELGSLYEINDVGNDFSVYNLNNDEWILQSNLTNNFKYNQKVLGVYGTASYEGKKWGVKAGLRAENTDLTTLLVNTNDENKYNYTNLFPSVHTSYKINERFSMQLGYSRRISRPRLWDLNPFFSIQNTYSIRKGNPDLLPEFADSYELTGIFIFDKFSFNSSIYHLYTTDIQERVSYFQDNVNIVTPENIGTRRQTGVELNGKYTPAKWLTINGDLNYGYFIREGSFNNQVFDFQGDQTTGKLSGKVKLPWGIETELSGNYRSRYKTVQGTSSGFIFADIGIRKKLWKGKGIVNLSVRDIFASRIRENIVDQPDYYLYSFSRRGRFVALGFSYSFGKGEAMTYSGSRHH